MSATVVTRAQRRAASEAALVDAAVVAFAAAGPAGVSLREVARAAGVTHPMVEQYFASKDGLVAAVGDRVTSTVASAIGRLEACDADGFAELLRTARRDPATTRLLVRAGLGDLRPTGFPACLDGRVVDGAVGRRTGGAGGRREERLGRYVASCLMLGWLTFDAFMTAAVRLGGVGERRRDLAVAQVAAHLGSIRGADLGVVTGRWRPSRVAAASVDSGRASGGADRSARDVLLAAAIELIAAEGPASVSIRDVGHRAGVNHGLVHRHFGSKRALITEVIEVGVASLLPGALAADGFDIAEVVEVMHLDPIPARLIARTLVDDVAIGSVRPHFPVMDGLLALARRAPAESRPAGLADPRLAAALAASMVGGSVIWGASLREVIGVSGRNEPALIACAHHLIGTPEA
jgi:AcrR family transcriptional regulator